MSETETDTDGVSNGDSERDVSQLYHDLDNTQEAMLAVFDLSKAEARAYVAVNTHPNSTVEHLAEDVLNRDRNYVTRPLRSLYEIGLISRTEEVFDEGGTGHIYSPIPSEEAERYFYNQLKDWIDELHDEIDRLDNRIDFDSTLENPLCERLS